MSRTIQLSLLIEGAAFLILTPFRTVLKTLQKPLKYMNVVIIGTCAIVNSPGSIFFEYLEIS